MSSGGARAQRDRLIAAQIAIFRNQDREDAAGVDYESDEYTRLHREYYGLAAAAPWWARIGVWRCALRRHQRSTRVHAAAAEAEVAVLPASGLLYRRLDDGQWWPVDVIPTGAPLAGPEIEALHLLVAGDEREPW